MLQVPDKFKDKFFVYGLRTKDIECKNAFDDIIGVHYPDGKTKEWVGTTKPGIYYLKHLINAGGCAILKEGIYEDTYQIALHQNKYEALCQRKFVSCYRDINKDNMYDYDPKTVTTGMYGINIHHAGIDSTKVDNWSAGCQVFKKLADFNEFLQICRDTKQKYFTYILQNIETFQSGKQFTQGIQV